MSNQVVWDLEFPTFTIEEKTRFRHIVSLFRSDSMVEAVLESIFTRDSFRIRVIFKEGYRGPFRSELRGYDVLFPSPLARLRAQKIRTWHERLLKEDEDF